MCSLTSTFLQELFCSDDGSEQQWPTAAQNRRQNKQILEESSQQAHATFENGADPSGTDRGLNPGPFI